MKNRQTTSSANEASRAIVRTCKCKHAGQDAIHGPQQRVFNPARRKVSTDEQEWRCTVCGAVQQ